MASNPAAMLKIRPATPVKRLAQALQTTSHNWAAPRISDEFLQGGLGAYGRDLAAMALRARRPAADRDAADPHGWTRQSNILEKCMWVVSHFPFCLTRMLLDLPDWVFTDSPLGCQVKV